MKILAIESSAVTASVAILTEEILTAEYTVNYKKTHSQTLLSMIDEVCRMTETVPEEFDLIAVSSGPGSYTGLRIGAATGKGLAFALGKKLAAVPTLEAMAYNLYGTNHVICPVLDARREHFYAGIYQFEEAKLCIRKEQSLLSYEELCALLNDIGQETEFVGSVPDKAKEVFARLLTCRYHMAPAHLSTQRAASVAIAASKMEKEGRIVTAQQFVPDYLRPSQAEREREKH